LRIADFDAQSSFNPQSDINPQGLAGRLLRIKVS
jgi:hypothetical protein